MIHVSSTGPSATPADHELAGDEPIGPDGSVSRRTLAKGLAWTVPAVGVGIAATAAPAYAASPFTCPTATCYSVPDTLIGAGGVLVTAVGTTATSVAMVGGPVTFNCVSQYGFLGGWTLWADSFTTSFTDHADITSTIGLTATTPSPLAVPVTIPATTYLITGWPWDSPSDGIFNVGQTAAHHITKICINYTAIFYGLGLPPVALGSCRFQVCYSTSRVLLSWSTLSLTKVSGPTPL